MNSSDVKERLGEDPGNPDFVEYAQSLLAEGNFSEAIEVSIRGLSANPSLQRGKLMLAKIFYEMDCIGFAAREVEELCKAIPENKALRQLLSKLKPDSDVDDLLANGIADEDLDEDSTVAEADFEIDVLDMMEEED